MSAEKSEPTAPEKWIPKTEEIVYVRGNFRRSLGGLVAVLIPNFSDIPIQDREPSIFDAVDVRPDPVPLLREFVSGRKYLVPAGTIIICVYCHKYQGDRAPAAPEYGEELHEEVCVVLRARAAYPEMFEEPAGVQGKPSP